MLYESAGCPRAQAPEGISGLAVTAGSELNRPYAPEL